MNTATLPILCGAALAIMAGAVGSHYASVNQMIAFAGMTMPGGMPPSEVQPMELASATPEDTRTMIAELQRQNVAMQQSLARNQASGTLPNNSGQGNPSDLNKVLSELVALNRDLRSQIAETNRDLMELRFQVDSHSEQFRPLNTIEEPVEELNSYDPSIGVLPPLDLP